MGSSALGVSAGEKHRALLEGRYTRFARIVIGKSGICSEGVGEGPLPTLRGRFLETRWYVFIQTSSCSLSSSF